MSDHSPALTKVEPSNSESNENPTAWLLVDAVDLLWLIPHRDALHLSPFTRSNASSTRCGEMNWQQETYPVLAWDKSIRLTNAPSEQCQSALLLQGPGIHFALACRRLLRLDAPVFYKLPQCMQGRRQFFTEVAVLENQAAGKVSAALLAKQLPGDVTDGNQPNRLLGGQR